MMNGLGWPENLLNDIAQCQWDCAYPSDFWGSLAYVLETLTENEKICVLSYYKDGKKFEVIASENGCTKQNVSRILERAREKLGGTTRMQILIHGVQGAMRLAEQRAFEKIIPEYLSATIKGVTEGHMPKHPAPLTTEELKQVYISEVDFPIRAKNCLLRAGYKTLGDITEASESEIKRVKNLGRQCFWDIVATLDKLGLHLKNDAQTVNRIINRNEEGQEGE